MLQNRYNILHLDEFVNRIHGLEINIIIPVIDSASTLLKTSVLVIDIVIKALIPVIGENIKYKNEDVIIKLNTEAIFFFFETFHNILSIKTKSNEMWNPDITKR